MLIPKYCKWIDTTSGHENNFDKADEQKTTGFGVPYDFRSVMHYSNMAFSANGRATIIPKVDFFTYINIIYLGLFLNRMNPK